MTARQLSREQVLALPPVITLAQLAQCLGVSEPVVRVMLRAGQLEALGIRVSRIGAQHRVITSTVHAYLGLADSTGQAAEVRQLRPVSGGAA